MPHKEGNHVLVIAGMHRSGTSLISQWLNKCGLNIGESLVGPNFSNTDGHFEDLDFYRFHEDALLSNKVVHTGLIEHKAPELNFYQKEKLQTIIAFKNRMHAQWGWKDPRTCLFLDTYAELIPEAYYLVITREYEYVLNSLLNRDFKEIEKKYLDRKWFGRNEWKIFRREKRRIKLFKAYAKIYLKVWINYNEELLKLIKHQPVSKFMVINYELLIDDDRGVFNRLTRQWGFKLDFVPFETIFKKGMLGKSLEVTKFIHNQPLLEKANQIQETLRNYISCNNAELNQKQLEYVKEKVSNG